MGFSLSPTVTVKEIDMTLTVPGLATSIAGIVGHFQWGPVDQITTIDSEGSLVKFFGQPDNSHYGDWFCASNFLSYSKNLQVARTSKNVLYTREDLTYALAGSTITTALGDWTLNFKVGEKFTISGSTSNDGLYTVAVVTPTVLTVDEALVNEGTANGEGTFRVGEFNSVSQTIEIPATGAVLAHANSIANDPVHIKNRDDFDQVAAHVALAAFYGRYPGEFGNGITVSAFNGARNLQAGQSPAGEHWTAWDYKNFFDYAPTGDEIFIVVVIEGEVVEKFVASQNAMSISPLGGTDYFVELINRTSRYIWAVPPSAGRGLSHQNNGVDATAPYSGTLITGYSVTAVDFTQALEHGANSTPATGDYLTTWDLFLDPEAVDVNFLLQGGGGTGVGKYLAENIAANRLDCLACMSPNEDDVVGDPTPATTIAQLRAAGGDLATSTSYAVMDGNYKQQYDKYNDTYRWVPFNGDIAGLMAYTDDVRDPWWSPAGLNRGQIKNVYKVAFNPTKTQRDELYKIGINPIAQFRGEGTVLFGDKTALNRPSAFSRINVRRLFITIEKAIATAARYQLFEFNDEVTRNAFLNLVEPYLRLVQGRRGINEYRVVCDLTNNTPEVIDRNEFVADIFIKPTYSINEIQLNFIAVKTGVAFEELILNPENTNNG